MPKVSKLQTQVFYKGPSSKGKPARYQLRMEWESPYLEYKKNYWKKLEFKKVVEWKAKAGGYVGNFVDTKQPPRIVLKTLSGEKNEEREFAFKHEEFETWLYWIIRSLVKYSKAPPSMEQIKQSPLLEKHKVKAITSRNVSVFDRSHQLFISALKTLEGGHQFLGKWNDEIKGEGGTSFDTKERKKLGKGANAAVFKMNMLLQPIKVGGNRTRESVALKIGDTNKKDITTMIREARMLALLGKHQNIVGIVDTFVSENHFCLFLEKGRCNLTGRKDETFSKYDVLGYAQDILAGVVHMHKCRAFHLDMKPENVIICGSKGKVDIAKIIDFGNTRSATLQKKPERFKGFPGLMEDWTRFGTPGYIGPESWAWGSQNIKSETQLAKRDSFAVGMTIINGLLAPFLNKSELKAKPREPKAKVLKRIQTWKKTFRDKTVEQKLRQNGLLDLAEAAVGLIEENPEFRLTVEEALRQVTQNAEIVKKNGMIEIMKI